MIMIYKMNTLQNLQLQINTINIENVLKTPKKNKIHHKNFGEMQEHVT